jgi:hypothetical protein
MGNEISAPVNFENFPKTVESVLEPDQGDCTITRLGKEFAKVLMTRKEYEKWLTVFTHLEALQKPIAVGTTQQSQANLEAADDLSKKIADIIGEIKEYHPDVTEAEIKSMNSLLVVMKLNAVLKAVCADENLLEKVNYQDFTDLLNSFDDDRFDFYYFGLMNWLLVVLIGNVSFRSAQVLANCLESRHVETKTGKNRLNLEQEDFDCYLAVQGFELKFKKFKYLLKLLFSRDLPPSAFDLKTSEILKGLKDYKEMEILPLELKTFEAANGAAESSIKMFEELSAAYKNYLESWKKIGPIWELMKCDVEAFNTGNLPLIKGQLSETLAAYTEDNATKLELFEKSVALRKEASFLFPVEKLKHKVANELEIVNRQFDIMSIYISIFEADQSNLKNEGLFLGSLDVAMSEAHTYFGWMSELAANGYTHDDDSIKRNFITMLITYKYNKTLYFHPVLKKMYTQGLKRMLEKFGFLEDLYQKYCDANSDFKIDDNDADDLMKGNGMAETSKLDDAGSEKMDVAESGGDAE